MCVFPFLCLTPSYLFVLFSSVTSFLNFSLIFVLLSGLELKQESFLSPGFYSWCHLTFRLIPDLHMPSILFIWDPGIGIGSHPYYYSQQVEENESNKGI